MDLYQVISYPLYAGAVLQIILGIALLKQAPRKSRAKRACAGLFFAAAAFLLSNAISYTLESQGRDYNFFNRVSWIGWFMIPACLQFAYYMQDEDSRIARIVGYVLYPFWSVVLLLTLFTDLVEPGDPSLIPFIDLDGPLEKPLRFVGAILAFWLLVVLYRTKNKMTGLKKSQFSLFFFGTLIFNIGCILVASVLPLFGAINPAFTTFVSLPWVVITYYAITRHRLFDLRLFVSRVLSTGFLLAVLSVMQVALFRLLSPVLGDSLSIAVSLSALGTFFFVTRLNRKMQDWVQALVLQDKYDYQKILQDSIKAITSILDLEELLGYFIGSVKKSLQVENSYLLLKEKNGHYSLKRGFNVQQEQVAGSPVIETLLDWLWQVRHGVVREELEHLTADGAGRMSEAMQTMGAELIIPLLYKEDLKGFMVLGRKGSLDPYFQSDIDLLETLAGHAAIAIENAQLYDEARQAKESMRESEAKFRTLAETAATGIFMHQGGNFLYANHASEIIGGYTIDEYLGMNFMGLVHRDYIDLVKTRARERIDGTSDIPRQYEFKIVKKNGEERWVLMTAGITEFEGKTTVMGTLIDITERKRAQEERYQMAALVENSSDFMGMSAMDGQVLFVNSGGRKLLGLDRNDDVKTRHVSDFMIQEDRPMFLEQILPNDFWQGEFRLRHFKTGLPVPVEMSCFKVFNQETEMPLTRAVVIRDITRLKKVREERDQYYQELQMALQFLQESEARFRTLAETTTAGIVIHRGGNFIYANPAIRKITGYDNEEVLALNFWDVIHPDYRDMARERGKARLQGAQLPTEYEVKIIIKNGEERWGNLTAGIIDYEGAPAIVVTFFDITDRKRAEEEQVRLYEQRIAIEKRHVVEKEKLLMDLHDGIGGITTNISILTELALKAADIEGVKSTLGTIAQLSREGIAEIRSFMHSLDAQDLNWRTIATELRNQGTNMVAPHGIAFALKATVDDVQEQPGSLLWVNLFKIYKESLTNAIKHSKANAIEVELKISREAFLLDIIDNGTSREEDWGKGRGIANMKKRAAELGGRMTLSSGNGTRMSLEIPLPLKYPA